MRVAEWFAISRHATKKTDIYGCCTTFNGFNSADWIVIDLHQYGLHLTPHQAEQLAWQAELPVARLRRYESSRAHSAVMRTHIT